MARIEWVLLCERAFLDRHERLSLVGVATHVRVPSLPLAISRIMMVARLTDGRPSDELAVGVAISKPCGGWVQPRAAGFEVEQAGEYLLVTLRDVPLAEAGMYRFAVALGEQEVVVEMPVALDAPPARLSVH